MILDDVLVNYDERRAAVAARVMTEFAAEGHQLLVFTCHEHILNIFKKLSADCRRLPSRFGEVFEEESEVEEEVIEAIVEEPQEEIVEEIVEVFEEPEVEEVYEEVAEEQPDLYYSATILPRSQPKPKPAPEPVAEYEFDMAPRQSAVEYDWDHDDVEFSDRLDASGRRMEEPLVVTRWD
jgi:hypothetical protein